MPDWLRWFPWCQASLFALEAIWITPVSEDLIASNLELDGSPKFFTLLFILGDSSLIDRVLSFDKNAGSFQEALYDDEGNSAGYRNGQPAGVDFSVKAGEGYFVYMK